MVHLKYLDINPNWTFKETVDNLKTLKNDYNIALASFSYFTSKERIAFLKTTRDSFYALKFERWKKDKIWDYMNGFEFLYVLNGIVKRSERRK